MPRIPPGITPAPLAFDDHGTPRSPTYGDVYHPRAGGLAQARHVFLGGNGLPRAWRHRERFVILETGFGQGLNFLAAWDAWRQDSARPARLHFLSIEKHPFRRDDLRTLHATTPELAPLAAALQAAWPELTAGMHRLHFEGGQVVLTLAFGDATYALPQLVAEPDAIFLDGFAPARNPDLWSPALLREIGLLSHPGTTLSTWTVATPVRDALAAAGFMLDKRPGFAAKREMLVGRRAACGAGHASTAGGGAMPAFSQVAGQAIVVGAGLAGCLTAEALARYGVAVTLLERQPAPAMETSGNRTAAMLPMLSLDDNRASRLNRACYLYALRTITAWRDSGHPIDGAPCGVLQIGRDVEHAAKQREIAERCGFPPGFVRCVDASEGAALAGLPVGGPGWWFAGGAWWNPPALCRAALAQAGERVTARYSAPVERIERIGDHWAVFDGHDHCLATATHLVLASAHDLLRLPQTAHLPLYRFRGQVTHVRAPEPAPLKCVVCKEGYVAPAWQGLHCVGASFHRGGEADLRESDHRANLDRLASMLPGYLPAPDFATLDGRVAFRPVSPDKLPIVGAMYRPDAAPQGRDLSAVDRWPDLHVATGYGARGLVWCVLMAELLASQLAGDPLPLESEIAATVDPARFLLRRRD